MANSVAVAFSGPDFSSSTVMGVFTREFGCQPQVWTPDGDTDNLKSETLPLGGDIHPDLNKALQLSGQTQNHFGVSPCGVVKALTQSEFAALPRWAARAAWLPGVRPV